MPRPKSDITDGISVTIRMNQQQRDMYHDLGGHDWLRKYLNRQIRSEEIQLGLSPQSSLLKNPKELSVRK